MTSMIQLVKEALEKKLKYASRDEPISILIAHSAAEDLLKELTNIVNKEDDGK